MEIRMPRDSSIAAREAAAMPLPSEETTPPVTKIYLVIATYAVCAFYLKFPRGPTNLTLHEPSARAICAVVENRLFYRHLPGHPPPNGPQAHRILHLRSHRHHGRNVGPY